MNVVEDRNDYPQPEELVLQLSYKDVYLDFFKRRTSYIERLIAGRDLIVRGDAFYVPIGGKEIQLGYFSNAFKARLNGLEQKGYRAETGSIRHIVLWKGENDTEEIPIILPDIVLKK